MTLSLLVFPLVVLDQRKEVCGSRNVPHTSRLPSKHETAEKLLLCPGELAQVEEERSHPKVALHAKRPIIQPLRQVLGILQVPGGLLELPCVIGAERRKLVGGADLQSNILEFRPDGLSLVQPPTRVGNPPLFLVDIRQTHERGSSKVEAFENFGVLRHCLQQFGRLTQTAERGER